MLRRLLVYALFLIAVMIPFEQLQAQSGFVRLYISISPSAAATAVNSGWAYDKGQVVSVGTHSFQDVNPDYEFEGWYRDGDFVAAWPDYTFGIHKDTYMVAAFTLRNPVLPVSTPTFSPSGGSYVGTTVEVSVSCATEGATIRYTMDGTEPTTSSPSVSSGGKVTVPNPGTLKARAWKTGMTTSSTRTASYTRAAVATPTFSTGGGLIYGDTVKVEVRCATPGATIRYTTNGSEPTESSLSVASGGTLTLAVPVSLRARAWKTGMDPSAVKAGDYFREDAMIFTTLAGLAGISGSTNGTGSSARFNSPEGMAVDAAGNVYVADSSNHTIRKMTPAGAVTTLAGLAGSSGSADGTGSSARFSSPQGVAVDAAGNVYVADRSSHTIRKVTPAGAVTTLAGLAGTSGSADGAGSAARFYYPWGVAVDAAGNVYVGDSENHTIRKVTPAGAVTTLAGQAGSRGDEDGSVSAARFSSPRGLAVDAAGNVYVADEGNHKIRKVTPGEAVTTLAGAGSWHSGSADGTGSNARFNGPRDLAMDVSGNVYVIENWNCTLRKVTSEGVVTTLAGRARTSGSADGIGSTARFNYPYGVAVDTSGNIYVADSSNHTIRRGAPVVASMPTFTPAGGTFSGGSVTVAVNCPLAGATLRYTTDGSDPTASSASVAPGGTVTVPVPGTLRAGAWKGGEAPSAMTTAYFATPPPVATPYFTPDGRDTFAGSVNVTVTCATGGATIRYTTDGSEPTESSATVASGGSVAVPVPGTLKAKAWKSGMNPSATKTARYTIVSFSRGNFGQLQQTAANRFLSEVFGELEFANAGANHHRAFSHSFQADLHDEGGGIASPQYGKLTPNPWGIAQWVVSEHFGLVHFGGDAGQYAGWVSSERFGWMRFVADAGGNPYLWVHQLQSWFAVNPDGSFHSFDFGWMVPMKGSLTRYNSRIGLVTVDLADPQGWLRSDRFGYVWFARDGTGVWFWSETRKEWIGITSGGGLWSTKEGRFL